MGICRHKVKSTLPAIQSNSSSSSSQRRNRFPCLSTRVGWNNIHRTCPTYRILLVLEYIFIKCPGGAETTAALGSESGGAVRREGAAEWNPEMRWDMEYWMCLRRALAISLHRWYPDRPESDESAISRTASRKPQFLNNWCTPQNQNHPGYMVTSATKNCAGQSQ